MRVTDKERRKYLKSISALLVCSSKTKKQFMADFSSNIDDFLQNDPDASLADLENALGTPQEIAEEFLSDASPKDIIKRTSYSRTIILITSLIAVFIIVITLLFAWDRYKTTHFVHGEEIIIYHKVVYEEESSTS